MARESKYCIFCGKQPTTREHIWADWLSNYISRTRVNYTASQKLLHEGGRIEVSDRLWGGDPHSRRLRIVCGNCNHHWMSTLQTAAKPTLIPMLQGKMMVLNEQRRKTLAIWCAMSVICAEYLSPKMAAISVVDRRWLFNNLTPPSSFKIWIGDFERGDWLPTWAHSCLRISHNSSSEHESMQGWAIHPDGTPRPNTQTTVFVVGRLYILLFSCPFPEIVRSPTLARLVEPRLVPLWPLKRGGYLAWPPRLKIRDADADELAGAIFRELDKPD